MTSKVDHAEIKLGQSLTMSLAVLAFADKQPAYLIALGTVFLVTGFYRPLSPFVLTYRLIVRPLEIMRSDYRLDNIQTHVFGQIIGPLTVLIALGLLYRGYGKTAWIVVWILFGLILISYLGWKLSEPPTTA